MKRLIGIAAALIPVALLLAPTVARWILAWCVIAFPYARLEGTGRTMKDNAHWIHFCLASIIMAISSSKLVRGDQPSTCLALV